MHEKPTLKYYESIGVGVVSFLNITTHTISPTHTFQDKKQTTVLYMQSQYYAFQKGTSISLDACPLRRAFMPVDFPRGDKRIGQDCHFYLLF